MQSRNLPQATTAPGAGPGRCRLSTSGERLITITAFDDQEEKNEVSKRFRVFNTDRTIALASCYEHYLALKANGTVAATGCDNLYLENVGQCNAPANLTDAVAIAGWHGYSLSALKQDGTVAAWGRFLFGEFRFDYHYWYMSLPAGFDDVVAITAGAARINALKADGTVVEWGCEPGDNDTDPKCGMHNVPREVTDVVAIAAGPQHSLALKADGTVVAWGDNGAGKCDVPISLRGVVALAGDFSNSLALKANGEVVSWGFHKKVPVRIGRDFKAIAVYDTNIGLREDGTVVAWWDENIIAMPLTPDYVVSGLKNIIAITYNMALAEDGSVIGFRPEWYGLIFGPAPDALQ